MLYTPFHSLLSMVYCKVKQCVMAKIDRSASVSASAELQTKGSYRT